jgi:hypothetical protein
VIPKKCPEVNNPNRFGKINLLGIGKEARDKLSLLESAAQAMSHLGGGCGISHYRLRRVTDPQSRAESR